MPSTNGRLYQITIRHPVINITLFARPGRGGPFVTAVHLGAGLSVKKPCVPHPVLKRYGRLIAGSLDGNDAPLASIPVDLPGRTPFARKVLAAARNIRRGTTVSYAVLARKAGFPRAVRAVASVMRNNPLPLIIPCHRVVKGDGSIGGFMGKRSGRAVALKKRLLEIEMQLF